MKDCIKLIEPTVYTFRFVFEVSANSLTFVQVSETVTI